MRVALSGGAYTARSIIAGAQACINLFGEPVQEGQGKVAYYPTPGLIRLGTAPQAGCRGLYRSKLGALYGVYGTGVYAIGADWSLTLLGSIAAGASRVSMADNGVVMAIVDGTSSGYRVTLSNNAFAPIVSAGFYGADYVEFFATYFIFNRPGLPQLYVSDSQALTFNALYFANFSGQQDAMMGIMAVHGAMTIVGTMHTEWWTTSGAPDFPFQPIPTATVDSGAVGKYSLARADNALFWISQNSEGQGVAIISRGYAASRISTHAIEAEWQSYARIDDAVGWTFQQGGHTLYVVTFPTAGRTWVFNLATQWWHQWGSFDGTALARHRAHSGAFAYGQNIVGDYETGGLYRLDPNAFTDDGAPITRRRAFPHLLEDGRRVFYTQFLADMECGTTTGPEPILTLEWSDDRGATYTGMQTASLGAAGAAITSVQFQRLGMARDRVFRLTWSAPVRTALMGAWVSTRTSGS